MQHTLFLTLILAHAIADYPLQTNAVYAMKVKRFGGIVLHVFIFTLTALVTILTVGWQVNTRLAAFLLLLTILHIVEDKLKLCCYRGNPLFWYVTDQIIHVLCIALLYVLPLRLIPTAWNPGSAIHSWLLAGIGVIYASYASSIGLHFYRQAFQNPEEVYQRNWGEIAKMGGFFLVMYLLLLKFL